MFTSLKNKERFSAARLQLKYKYVTCRFVWQAGVLGGEIATQKKGSGGNAQRPKLIRPPTNTNINTQAPPDQLDGWLHGGLN